LELLFIAVCNRCFQSMLNRSCVIFVYTPLFIGRTGSGTLTGDDLTSFKCYLLGDANSNYQLLGSAEKGHHQLYFVKFFLELSSLPFSET
jgi:hypothetical protein